MAQIVKAKKKEELIDYDKENEKNLKRDTFTKNNKNRGEELIIVIKKNNQKKMDYLLNL